MAEIELEKVITRYGTSSVGENLSSQAKTIMKETQDKISEALKSNKSITIAEINEMVLATCAKVYKEESGYDLPTPAEVIKAQNTLKEGAWWQDDVMRNMAINELIGKIGKSGALYPEQLSVEDMQTLQALIGVKPTGVFDENTSQYMTNLLKVLGVNYEGTPIDANMLKTMREYDGKVMWREGNYWLENGGNQIFAGFAIIAAGTAQNAANGVYGSGSGGGSSVFTDNPNDFNPTGLTKKTYND
ncbi:MAG: hypothetical protein RR275_09410, partial [Lachnospiraceae bacterium]